MEWRLHLVAEWCWRVPSSSWFECEGARALELIRPDPHQMARAGVAAPLSPTTLDDDFWVDEDGGMWMRLPSGRWMLVGSDENV